MQAVRRLFFWFYPSRPKFTHTEQGRSMRSTMLWMVVMHWIFFLVAFTFIGFKPMICQMAWGLWAYSTYLSLREMQIVLYIATMVMGIGYKAIHFADYEQMQLLVYVLETVFLGVGVYLVGLAYWEFRKAGGVKGHSRGISAVIR